MRIGYNIPVKLLYNHSLLRLTSYIFKCQTNYQLSQEQLNFICIFIANLTLLNDLKKSSNYIDYDVLKIMWARYILQLGSPSNVVNYWSFANIKLRTHFVQRISIFLQFTVRNLRAKHNVSYLIIICAQGKQ